MRARWLVLVVATADYGIAHEREEKPKFGIGKS